jgi:hypothetical protein
MPSIAVCSEGVLSAVPHGTPPAFRNGDQPGNFSTQQLSTSGNITSAASPKSGTSATFQQASSTTEVSPTECELVYASDDDGEDF